MVGTQTASKVLLGILTLALVSCSVSEPSLRRETRYQEVDEWGYTRNEYQQRVYQDVESIRRNPDAAKPIFERLRYELSIDYKARMWSGCWMPIFGGYRLDDELYRNSRVLFELVSLWAYVADNGNYVHERYQLEFQIDLDESGWQPLFEWIDSEVGEVNSHLSIEDKWQIVFDRHSVDNPNFFAKRVLWWRAQ